MMFNGEYSHSVDAKGRVIIPSDFRELLGAKFWLTKGLDGCLNIYAEEEWEKFEQKLAALPITNKGARKFSRFMHAGATHCETDRQGRILVPANLREYAAIGKDAVMIGNGNHVEIWSRERWDAEQAEENSDESLAEGLDGLGIGI